MVTDEFWCRFRRFPWMRLAFQRYRNVLDIRPMLNLLVQQKKVEHQE